MTPRLHQLILFTDHGAWHPVYTYAYTANGPPAYLFTILVDNWHYQCLCTLTIPQQLLSHFYCRLSQYPQPSVVSTHPLCISLRSFTSTLLFSRFSFLITPPIQSSHYVQNVVLCPLMFNDHLQLQSSRRFKLLETVWIDRVHLQKVSVKYHSRRFSRNNLRLGYTVNRSSANIGWLSA